MSPPQKRGFYKGFDLPIKIILVQQTATVSNPTGGARCRCQIPNRCMGSLEVGLDIDRCISMCILIFLIE